MTQGRLAIGLAVLAVFAVALLAVPAPAAAVDHSSCMYCHTPHQAIGGNLTRVQGFDALCESCHATGTNAAPDALTHVTPLSGNPYWNFGCHNCHTNHSSLKNRDYQDSADVLNATRTGTGPYTATVTLSKDLGLLVGNWIWLNRVISNVPVASPGLIGYNGGWQVTAVDSVNKTVSFQSPDDPNTYVSGGISAVGHAHTGGGGGGGLNIKLTGRDEDGSGIANIATPLRLRAAVYNNTTPPAPCTSGNVMVQVELPFFRDGYGPPHTVMVGDRVEMLNVNPAAWDGDYAVVQTFKGANQDRVCLLRTFGATPGTYAGTDLAGQTVSASINNGWLFSRGWATPLTVTGAAHSSGAITFTLGSAVTALQPYSAGSSIVCATRKAQGQTVTATVQLSASIGLAVDDTVVVSGVDVAGYDGTYQLSAIDTVLAPCSTPSVSYVIPANPGANGSGGTASTADGDIVRVWGVSSGGPGSYNGKWEVSAVNTGAQTVTVRCPPAHYTEVAPSAACPLIAAGGGWVEPGTWSSGGKMQSSGTIRPVIFESRGADFGYSEMNSFADEDMDGDAVMDSVCQLCHHSTVQNYQNDIFAPGHNKQGVGCTLSCHPHEQGFDRTAGTGDSPCPAVGCIPPAQPFP